MRKKIGIIVMMAALLGVIAVSRIAGDKLLAQIERRKSISAGGRVEEPLVILDSGHGGKDPGKIGVNNVLEKDINLQIALKIQKMLEKNKIEVIMTRTDDANLQEAKTEDLKARVELINQTKPLLAVSIHQNSYPDAEIHGAQVFYYMHSKEGEYAAEILQETLRKVDPDNHRQAKANDTYYMLKKTEVPVVIAECGFLSNLQEAEKLCEEAYQMELAQAITEGILEYIK